MASIVFKWFGRSFRGEKIVFVRRSAPPAERRLFGFPPPGGKRVRRGAEHE